MEPVEQSGPRRGLQAAREPLSLRFLLAFSASTVLTAAVAVPMAFQAHLARDDERAPLVEHPPVAVLGATTVPVDPAPDASEGLVHVTEGAAPAPLQRAELSGDFDLQLQADDVARVDFALDDHPVVSDTEAPWQPDAEGTRPTLTAGEHSLTATVTFADGHVEVRRATFRVVAG
jgi:prepilin-type processing-associated H-X9-DG protein